MRFQKFYFKVPLLLAVLVTFIACGNNFVTMGDEHKVSIDTSMVGGRIKVAANMFAVGANVAVEVIPDAGYEVVENSLTYSMGKRTVPIRSGAFNMPAGDVLLSAQFAQRYDTQIEAEDIIYFQGDMIFEPVVSSTSDNYYLEWYSEDVSIVDLAEVSGRPLARNLLGLTRGGAFGRKSGSTTITITSSEGSFKNITVVSLPRYFTVTSDGIVTAVSSDYSGGELFVPSYIDGVEVRGIGEGVFANKKITSVVLPSTLKSIEEDAFRGNSIESLILPAAVENVASGAFAKNNLIEVNVSATSPSQSSIAPDAFGDNLISVVVDTASLAEYRRSQLWESYVAKLTSSDTFRITINQIEYGSISVAVGGLSVVNALPGEEVMVSIHADDAHQYTENTLRYMGMTSGRISMIPFDDVHGFVFKMPSEAVLIMADFESRDFVVDLNYFGPQDNTVAEIVPAPEDKKEKWGVVSVSRNGNNISDYKMVVAPNGGFVLNSVIVNYNDGEKFLYEVPTVRVTDLVYSFNIPESNMVENGVIDVSVEWKRTEISLLFSTGDAQVTKVMHPYGMPLPAMPFSLTKLNSDVPGNVFKGFYDSFETGGNCYYGSDGKVLNPQTPFAPPYYGTEVTLYAHYDPISVNMTVRNGMPMEAGFTASSAARKFAQEIVTVTEVSYGSSFGNLEIPILPSELAADFKNYEFIGYFKDPSDNSTQTHDRYGLAVSRILSSETEAFEVIGCWKQRPIAVKVDFGFDVKNLPSTNEAEYNHRPDGVVATFYSGSTPIDLGLPVPYRPTFRCVGLYDRPNEISSTNKLGEKYYDIRYSPGGPADGTGDIVLGDDGFPVGASLVPRSNTKVKCLTEDNVLTLYPAWNFDGEIIKDAIVAEARLRELHAGVHTYGIFSDVVLTQHENLSAINLLTKKKNDTDKTAKEIIGGNADTVLRLYIHDKVTLTAKAGKTYGTLGGRAGIHVPKGTRLEIYGGGTLIVEGGYTDPAYGGRFSYQYVDYEYEDNTYTIEVDKKDKDGNVIKDKDGNVEKETKEVTERHSPDLWGDTDRFDSKISEVEAWVRANKLFNSKGELVSYKSNPTRESSVYIRDPNLSDDKVYVRAVLTDAGDVPLDYPKTPGTPYRVTDLGIVPTKRHSDAPSYNEFFSGPGDEGSSKTWDKWGAKKTSSDGALSTFIGPNYDKIKMDREKITYQDLCQLWLAEDGFSLKAEDSDYKWGDISMDMNKVPSTKRVHPSMLALGAWGTPGAGAAIGSHGGHGGTSGGAGQDGYPAGEIVIADTVSLQLTVYEGLPTHGGMGGAGNNINDSKDAEGVPGGGGGGGGGVGAPIGGGGGGGGGGAFGETNCGDSNAKNPAFGGEYGVPSSGMHRKGDTYYGAGGYGGLGGGGNFWALGTKDHKEVDGKDCTCRLGEHCILSNNSDYATVYDSLTVGGKKLYGFANYHGKKVSNDIDAELRSPYFLVPSTTFRVGSYNYLCLLPEKPIQYFRKHDDGSRKPDDIKFTYLAEKSKPLSDPTYRAQPGMQGSVEKIDFSKWIRPDTLANFDKSSLGKITIIQKRLYGDGDGLIQWPTSAIYTNLGNTFESVISENGKARCNYTYTTDAGCIPAAEALLLTPTNRAKIVK